MTIKNNIDEILQKIHMSMHHYQRQPNTVHLLAVSKGQPISAIEQAYHAGLRNFGESYLQESLLKIEALTTLPILWHFIGPIQSNKAKAIAQNFSWVHSVSRKDIAQKLNENRPSSLPLLNICIQVNLDAELTKSGTDIDSILELAQFILQLPRLHLRGLMCIPKPMQNSQQQYQTFLRLTNLLEFLNTKLHTNLDTLSMGMSDDLDAAIHAGSTIIRIGRGIFGERG